MDCISLAEANENNRSKYIVSSNVLGEDKVLKVLKFMKSRTYEKKIYKNV